MQGARWSVTFIDLCILILILIVIIIIIIILASSNSSTLLRVCTRPLSSAKTEAKVLAVAASWLPSGPKEVLRMAVLC